MPSLIGANALGPLVMAILLGGVVVGSLDILAAAVINGAAPGAVLKVVASGVLGRAVHQGGAKTMVLGRRHGPGLGRTGASRDLGPSAERV